MKIEGDRAVSLFEEWWSKLPSYNKVAKREALKAWKSVLKDLPMDRRDELVETLTEALQKQEYYRNRMKEISPDKFVPSRPHPATWLRQGRWLDPVEPISDQMVNEKVRRLCSCGKESFIEMEGQQLCCRCYTNKYDNDTWSMKALRDSARKLGLTRQEGETMDDVSIRARQLLKERFKSLAFVDQ